MTDPSSQNPFNSPEETGGGDKASQKSGEENPQPKLKLKQLLTPLSPHLNVEHKKKESAVEDMRPKLEIPRAVPAEPEPELAPHERPSPLDAIPQAVPMEPEPELAPHERPPSPDGTPLPPAVGTAPTAEAAPPEKETVEKLVSAPQKKPRGLKKIALPLLAIILLIAAILYYFDPLGLSIDPIAHEEPVLPTAPQQLAKEETPPVPTASNYPSLELDEVTTNSFLNQFEELVIITSENPKGAIIDSVFFPEGSALNPMLGLVLKSVEGTGKNGSITIVDSEGKEYEFDAN